MTTEYHRRKEDTAQFKIVKYGKGAAAIIAIASMTTLFGNSIWATRDTLNNRCAEIQKKIYDNERENEVRHTKTEIDVIEIKTDIKYIIKLLEKK